MLVHAHVRGDALVWGTNVFEGMSNGGQGTKRYHSLGAIYFTSFYTTSLFVSDLSRDTRLTDLGAPGPRYRPVFILLDL